MVFNDQFDRLCPRTWRKLYNALYFRSICAEVCARLLKLNNFANFCTITWISCWNFHIFFQEMPRLQSPPMVEPLMSDVPPTLVPVLPKQQTQSFNVPSFEKQVSGAIAGCGEGDVELSPQYCQSGQDPLWIVLPRYGNSRTSRTVNSRTQNFPLLSRTVHSRTKFPVGNTNYGVFFAMNHASQKFEFH